MGLPASALESEHVQFFACESAALGGRGDVAFFVPPGGEAMPLVILLNGVYGSHRAWVEQGEAHRTALRLINEGRVRPMVLAMPADGVWSLGKGFSRHVGGAYERWIMEDVIHCARYRIPGLGPDVFLAGLSIGGYGALRLGAKYGARLRGISAHSPITRLHDMDRFMAEPNSYLAEEPFVGVWIARHRAALPALRFDCGTEDPLLDASRRLHEELVRQNVVHVYQEFPGAHDWDYWKTHLADTLVFFEHRLKAAAELSAPREGRRSEG
jgi:enterochelin esterase-like enzyme